MAGLSLRALAKEAGVSHTSVQKALRRGYLRRGEAGIDPADPRNVGWIARHRAAAAANDMAVEEVPPAALDEVRGAPSSAPSGGAFARSQYGDSHIGADGGEGLRATVPGAAIVDLDRLLENVARSITDGFNTEGKQLVAVLSGLDARLGALESAAGQDERRLAAIGEAMLKTANFADLANIQIDAAASLGGRLEQLRAAGDHRGERLSAAEGAILAAIAELKMHLGGLVKLLSEKL